MAQDSRPDFGFHVRAFNGHDVDTLASHAAPGARCIRDGELVGEGPQAVRRALLEEYKLSADLVGRLMELDGESVVVEWADEDGARRPVGVLRVQGGPRITEFRIDHDPDVVDRLARAAPRREILPVDAHG